MNWPADDDLYRRVGGVLYSRKCKRCKWLFYSRDAKCPFTCCESCAYRRPPKGVGVRGEPVVTVAMESIKLMHDPGQTDWLADQIPDADNRRIGDAS
jgi:hypothetical protein